jgi:hypothetical protein
VQGSSRAKGGPDSGGGRSDRLERSPSRLTQTTRLCIPITIQPDGTKWQDFLNERPVPLTTTPKLPKELIKLGYTLDSHLLSVKDGIGIYGVYNNAQEIACLV